jgi:long-chain acyl-CoA synthetase
VKYRNLTELHRRQAERLGARPALRFKRHGLYRDVSWEQYRADALACAAALADAGIKPGDRVGLLGENRVEWLITDMGIQAASAVNVPPHCPLSPRQVHFQFTDAGVRWVFVSNAEQLEKIQQIRSELPLVEGVVLFDRSPLAREGLGRDGVISWDWFMQHGRQIMMRMAPELARREEELSPDKLATVMYTSGTTGNPKGVMLTHGNLVSNSTAALNVAPVEPDDVFLNWLPFSHIYARTCDHYQSLAAGVVLCLAESAETLVQNLAEIQPTHMSAVPRFYEKVLTAVASPDRDETSRRLRAIFGSRIKWLSAGGAPLPKPIGEAMVAAGLPVYQGYGLTESSPIISFNRKDFNKVGTVGLPLPGIEVKIAPDGEVLTRGTHVMKGYWNNPKATDEAIQDGWLYTGDLGELDADGYLSITGRKKDLMVLSNGKKVIPTELEGMLLGQSCIDQAVIYGEGRNFLTAIIVPQWENLKRSLKEAGVQADGKPEEALAKDPAVLAYLRTRVDTALADMSNWEQVRKFLVLPRPFTVAAEELTVSLKLRRNVVFGKYKEQLEALYKGEPEDRG